MHHNVPSLSDENCRQIMDFKATEADWETKGRAHVHWVILVSNFGTIANPPNNVDWGSLIQLHALFWQLCTHYEYPQNWYCLLDWSSVASEPLLQNKINYYRKLIDLHIAEGWDSFRLHDSIARNLGGRDYFVPVFFQCESMAMVYFLPSNFSDPNLTENCWQFWIWYHGIIVPQPLTRANCVTNFENRIQRNSSKQKPNSDQTQSHLSALPDPWMQELTSLMLSLFQQLHTSRARDPTSEIQCISPTLFEMRSAPLKWRARTINLPRLPWESFHKILFPKDCLVSILQWPSVNWARFLNGRGWSQW